MSLFTVAEPHPTVRKNTYTHSGRGGSGNYFRAPATTPSSGVVSPAAELPPTTSRFHSGRGGAGNAHVSVERPVMSFDDEFTRQSKIETKPIGHVGRGGAGNVFAATNGTTPGAPRKGSDASIHSNSSAGSMPDFVRRISSTFARR
ncbi:Uu.00g098880.m01.CDS01 [Anthostomella pinea]|uniref:Uu.00g098880.m01.CDS01 n=1 Tax=Anthostomella pinea TaxID=933095 RepID=A0AAI8VCJ8_9PEZI|nr:Uu.00g098880.m01.CDS01 [Anthostomella pinea]